MSSVYTSGGVECPRLAPDSPSAVASYHVTVRRVACWLVLRLLIDTSTWLDLAARRDGQKWIVPLRVLKFHSGLELLVPSLVLAEFERNRPRSEMAVSTGMLDRIRQLRRDLRAFVFQDDEEPSWLTESAQRVPLVNAMAPQNFREIDDLLRDGTILEPTDLEKVRAFQRGLDKTAPFTSDKNSAADALLIESYATQVAAENADVYAFVTSNHRDFSMPNGDHRQPHPDLAGLFDGSRSHYAYKVEGLHDVLLGYFGDEFREEYNEVEFLISDEEPRTLAEIIEAEQEFFDRVWYVRSVAGRDEDRPDSTDDLRAGILSARERIEAKFGREDLWKAIGPGHDPAWEYGYISGKLATLRWVLGSEWDFLDT
jgi:hypothetical protein